MSPERQRIAIAEACGWKPTECGRYEKDSHGTETRVSQTLWHKNGDPMTATLILPDYLADLNAMHEAEKTLKCGDSHRYYLSLVGIASTSGRKHVSRDFAVTCATAAQRAEAFLRTLSRWDDGKAAR